MKDPAKDAAGSIFTRAETEKMKSAWTARNNEMRSTGMSDESDEDENYEDENEGLRSSEIPMPPSAEVPRKSASWLIVLIAAMAAGYPVQQWAQNRWALHKEQEKSLRECRVVGINVEIQHEVSELREACLPPKVWKYYTERQGLTDRQAAIQAAMDYLRNDEPWKKP